MNDTAKIAALEKVVAAARTTVEHNSGYEHLKEAIAELDGPQSELDFSGAREALEQVAAYSREMERNPGDDYLRQCRDGWSLRLRRCLALNGVTGFGPVEPSLPVPAI